MVASNPAMMFQGKIPSCELSVQIDFADNSGRT